MDNSTTTTASSSSPSAVQKGVSTAAAVTLSITGTTLSLCYLLTLVGIYRVSKKLNPFILFLSHGVADIGLLALMPTLPYIQQIFNFILITDPNLQFYLFQVCAIATYLHVLLIALNRGHSMLSPLSYNNIWTRQTCYASVLLVWVINLTIVGCIVGLHLAGQTATALSAWKTVFPIVQYITIGTSFVVYSGVVLVILARQLLGMDSPLNFLRSTLSPRTRRMRVRLFAYCFLSFLPVSYNLVMNPSSSLLFVLSVQAIHSTHGLLLFVMSSVVRRKMPFRAVLGFPVGEETTKTGAGARSQPTVTFVSMVSAGQSSEVQINPRYRSSP